MLIENVRRELAATNPDLPFLDPRTMTEHISASMVAQFIGASMLSGFGAIALILKTVVLYGVLSYTVSQRKREMAIRAAIGAPPKAVMILVIKQGLTLTMAGLIIGTVLALAGGRLLQSQLLGISSADPLTYAGIILLLAAVALGACYVPARRAAKVDPLVALRYE